MNPSPLSELNERHFASNWSSSSLSRSNNKDGLANFNSNLSIVGYYSVDSERNYLPDSSNLLYYNPPKYEDWDNLFFNLNQGIELAVRNPTLRMEGRISHLLQWIKLNYTKIQAYEATDRWIEPDFVCSCGLLTALLGSPYQFRANWIIRAIKWKGTIYLCLFKDNTGEDTESDTAQRYTSWGYKFEQFMLTSAPGKNPETHKPVKENAEFRCVYRRCIGSHSVLFCSEMDGLLSDTKLKDPLPLEDLKFVELKTSALINNGRKELTFKKYKTLKWWCQSILTNTDQIVCGFRDDDGIVHKLANYSLDALVNKSQGCWKPRRCIDHCRDFLTFISKVVVAEKTMYKFEKRPYNSVSWSEEPFPSEFDFLPTSFLNVTNHER